MKKILELFLKVQGSKMAKIQNYLVDKKLNKKWPKLFPIMIRTNFNKIIFMICVKWQLKLINFTETEKLYREAFAKKEEKNLRSIDMCATCPCSTYIFNTSNSISQEHQFKHFSCYFFLFSSSCFSFFFTQSLLINTRRKKFFFFSVTAHYKW